MGRGIVILPPEAEKTGRTREELRRVALSRQAVELLAAQRSASFAEGIRSEFVLATTTGERPHSDSLKPILYGLRGRRSNGLPASRDKRAMKRARVLPDDVTIHDIRRTVADALLNRIGTAPWIVDHVILGHARPKLLRTYMPTLPVGEARDALQKWGDELADIVERASSLRRALPEAHGQGQAAVVLPPTLPLQSGSPLGSSALLPEDDVRQFLPEPIRLLRIGRLLEPTRESQEALSFRLFCLEASLDEVHEDAVGAQLSRLRNRAYSLRDDGG